MTDAARSVERVVSVRKITVREAETGLGFSAALLAALAVAHPDWTVAAFYGGLALLTSAYTVLRAVVKFRRRLPDAEPLPTEAVEVALPVKALSLGRALLFITGVVALVVPFSNVRWVIEPVAGLVATGISFQLVQPLVEAHLVSHWEPTHGRLFRCVEDDNEDEAGLYVAERPVPAA
jgi:hypothetical protein